MRGQGEKNTPAEKGNYKSILGEMGVSQKKGASYSMTHPLLYLFIVFYLELCVLWCTWEWNHITDVLHTGYEEDQTLETETETCMWT